MQNPMQIIELLAPAKDLSCGIAAITHGADAVYIGASFGGARQAASNDLKDIALLCDFAHRFGAKVYVTLNTIVYDSELTLIQKLINDLSSIGVDAFLLQDMGLLKICSDEIADKVALHASTQCDCRTAQKAKWLNDMGFERVVLARELSLKQIKEIHNAVPNVELEVFIHGAICVSYSGICYASQFCFNRSANRGECSQFCRMPFNLIDSNGTEIEHQRYLLSMKDMNQLSNIEQLLEAGACSFKIEGRLKNINYVKNVVAAYSNKFNNIISKYPKLYRRASFGSVKYTFDPDLSKTFNRGYTTYFFNGRQKNIYNPITPKALGEKVGVVDAINKKSFSVEGNTHFCNGDGLCYVSRAKAKVKDSVKKTLEGFRVNKVSSNWIFPLKMPRDLVVGTVLYRNQDHNFENALIGDTASRKIKIEMSLDVKDNLCVIEAQLLEYRKSSIKLEVNVSFEPAKTYQRDNIIRQLTKLGDTNFVCNKVEVSDEAAKAFIPNSELSNLRRKVVNLLYESIIPKYHRHSLPTVFPSISWEKVNKKEYQEYPYLLNISNHLATNFYKSQGFTNLRPAFERDTISALKASYGKVLIMQCKHCIRYALGYCQKHGGKHAVWKEPLFLELSDKRRFQIKFDCKNCQMLIYGE